MQKIQAQLDKLKQYHMFDLKEEVIVLERFIADNMLMVGYFTHHLNEHILVPINKLIRRQLEQQS